jgi:hypothetical protein
VTRGANSAERPSAAPLSGVAAECGTSVIPSVIPPVRLDMPRARLLDDAPDLTCKDGTGRHPIDDREGTHVMRQGVGRV